MPDDTSLVRMVIQGLAERNAWTYEETMERLYKSKTCRLLSDRDTGMFTFSPREVKHTKLGGGRFTYHRQQGGAHVPSSLLYRQER